MVLPLLSHGRGSSQRPPAPHRSSQREPAAGGQGAEPRPGGGRGWAPAHPGAAGLRAVATLPVLPPAVPTKDLIETCCAAGQQWAIDNDECLEIPETGAEGDVCR